MTRSQKKKLIFIIAAAVLFVGALFVPVDGWLKALLFVVPYLVVGHAPLMKAGRNILNGQIFDENFLMSIATIGAFAIGEYAEAVGVMLFYRIGELFESIAVGKSRKAISGLVDLRPEYANIERDGELTEVDPYDVSVGDIIVVKPGEKVPLDGIVIDGSSTLNTAALTGESLPRDVGEGDEIISGCVNIQGMLHVRVTKNYDDSTVAKILELIEDSSSNKSASESFITRFAKYYTPAVVAAAVAVAVIPALFAGGFTDWLYRALMFLVVSCPCAFVISVPLSFFAGIGGASRRGILIKGSNFLEYSANVKTVVFDKTGTVTKGNFKVSRIHSDELTEDELLSLAAHAECYAEHPIAVSVKNAYSGKIDTSRVESVEQLAGRGVSAVIDGRRIFVGNEGVLLGCTAPEIDAVGTVVHVAEKGKYLGYIIISDEIKEASADAVASLKAAGNIKTVMLTGDREAVAANVALDAGIDEYHAELLPADKSEWIAKLKGELSPNEKLMFVGDGINDVPSLSGADIGVAMGALGSDAAIEAADIVIMDDDLSKVGESLAIAKKTMRIVWQNIIFAFAVKLAVILLGLLGISTMWEAVFADVGVTVIAVLNAMRALKK